MINLSKILIAAKKVQQTTTTKPFVPSIWGRLHEPKENYAGSGTWISFLHSFLLSNMPSLRPLGYMNQELNFCQESTSYIFFTLLLGPKRMQLFHEEICSPLNIYPLSAADQHEFLLLHFPEPELFSPYCSQ